MYDDDIAFPSPGYTAPKAPLRDMIRDKQQTYGSVMRRERLLHCRKSISFPFCAYRVLAPFPPSLENSIFVYRWGHATELFYHTLALIIRSLQIRRKKKNKIDRLRVGLHQFQESFFSVPLFGSASANGKGSFSIGTYQPTFQPLLPHARRLWSFFYNFSFLYFWG